MRVTCPECNHPQTIDDAQAGASVTCEECRFRFQAHAAEGIQEGLPPAKQRIDNEDDRMSRRDRHERPSGSSGGKIAAIVIGGTLLVFFLLCGVGALGGFFFAFVAHHEHVGQDMPPIAVQAEEVEVPMAVRNKFVQPNPDAKPAADVQERIRNGDFEQGNKGFRTQYQFSPLNLRPELAYDIISNPVDAHTDAARFGDHSTGKGKMLMVNGGNSTDRLVWGQTVDVRPDADYTFRVWVASWTVFAPAQIDVRINGMSVGQVTASAQTGEWKEFRVTWNSTHSNSATIEIYDLNPAFSGNDFVLDDISLRGPEPK